MDQRGSILVVDDEPTITDVVARYLERAGYATAVAADGPGALRIAGESRPDLVVLDLMLPGMDGLEVMRRLRERERVSVILLTAKGEHTDRIIGLRLGADDYVVKPFSPAELVARVDAVLRARSTARPELEEPIAFDDLELDPVAPPGDRPRRGGAADRAGVRAPAALRAPSRPGLLARPADGRGLAVQLLHRHRRPSRSTCAGCGRRSRRTPPSRAGCRPVWGVGYRFQP